MVFFGENSISVNVVKKYCLGLSSARDDGELSETIFMR